MKKFVLLAACALMLTGCTGVTPLRTVHNNTFYSSYLPRVQVDVSPEIPYVGGFEKAGHASDSNSGLAQTNTRKAYWLFAQKNTHGNAINVVDRAVILYVEELPRNSNWLFNADLLHNVKNPLDKGREQIHGKDYDWAVAVYSGPFDSQERKAFEKLGFTIGNRYMSRFLCRKISKTAITVICYTENIDCDKSSFSAISPMGEGRTYSMDFVKEFLARSREAVTLSEFDWNNVPGELGQPWKIADEQKSQKAPVNKHADAAEPI